MVQRLGCNLIKRGDLLLSLVVSYKSRENERITMARIDSVHLNTRKERDLVRNFHVMDETSSFLSQCM